MFTIYSLSTLMDLLFFFISPGFQIYIHVIFILWNYCLRPRTWSMRIKQSCDTSMKQKVVMISYSRTFCWRPLNKSTVYWMLEASISLSDRTLHKKTTNLRSCGLKKISKFHNQRSCGLERPLWVLIKSLAQVSISYANLITARKETTSHMRRR